MNSLRAAAVQLNATADRAANIAVADRLTREAAGRGAQLVVLPEKWPLLGSGAELKAGAEPIDGPAMSWARETARDLGIELLAGSFTELLGDGRRQNTSLHISPDGEIRSIYRKIHMFDVVVGGFEYRESEHEDPGDEIVVSRTDDGLGLGMSVCYDLRFPELYRILALRGARVIAVPAAFTLATTRDHWETLLRARAIENQAFVVAANQIGENEPGRFSGGRSMIIDPWGVVLAQATDTVGVIVADLDMERLESIRESLPSLANRRPRAYSWPDAVAAHDSEDLLH
ncbi:MAG TPA: carbon-nitrogen hydrolase family protein [Solirubrobacteraceae bacterium]|nr:carbon-nitrogen hydrolase family protein [Solirubrobacteraceae bacterium]